MEEHVVHASTEHQVDVWLQLRQRCAEVFREPREGLTRRVRLSADMCCRGCVLQHREVRIVLTSLAWALKNNKNHEIKKDEKELLFALNYAIKSVDKDMESFSFNTAIARLMELLNAVGKYDQIDDAEKNTELYKVCFNKFIQLLAPCAPHFSEEIWEILGNKNSVFLSSYPVCEEKYLVKDEVEIAVQINSKMRGKITVINNAKEEDIKSAILSDEKLACEIKDKNIKKFIIVPNRLVNIII